MRERMRQHRVRWWSGGPAALLAAMLLTAELLRAQPAPGETVDITVVSGTTSAERGAAVIPLLPWKGLESLVRYRQFQNYEVREAGASLRPVSHHVVDVELSRPLTRALDLALTVENLTSRSFHETVNHAELRLPASPGVPRLVRGFTSDPVSISATITWHLGRN